MVTGTLVLPTTVGGLHTPTYRDRMVDHIYVNLYALLGSDLFSGYTKNLEYHMGFQWGNVKEMKDLGSSGPSHGHS